MCNDDAATGARLPVAQDSKCGESRQLVRTENGAVCLQAVRATQLHSYCVGVDGTATWVRDVPLATGPTACADVRTRAAVEGSRGSVLRDLPIPNVASSDTTGLGSSLLVPGLQTAPARSLPSVWPGS